LIEVAKLGPLRHRLSIGDAKHDVIGGLIVGPANPTHEKLGDVCGNDGSGWNGRPFFTGEVVALAEFQQGADDVARCDRVCICRKHIIVADDC
jgi:hypothetical protein